MKKEIIRLENVSYSYNKKDNVLSDINLSVFEGDDISIIGHNGSGKSTLALILSSLIKPNKGKLLYNDTEINNNNDSIIRENVGIVFQNPESQFIGATVEEDIAFGLENKQISQIKMKEIVENISKKIGIFNLLNKEPNQLSGGQKQRVALASVLAMSPNVIIFDEALSMIDPNGRNEILKLIEEIKIENPNLTIIRITHNLDEAFDSNKIILLNKGNIILNDHPINVFQNKILDELKISKPFIVELNQKLLEEKLIEKPIYDLNKLGELLCK